MKHLAINSERKAAVMGKTSQNSTTLLHAEAFETYVKALVLVSFSALVTCLLMNLHPCILKLCLFAQSQEYKMLHGIPQGPHNKVPHIVSESQ